MRAEQCLLPLRCGFRCSQTNICSIFWLHTHTGMLFTCQRLQEAQGCCEAEGCCLAQALVPGYCSFLQSKHFFFLLFFFLLQGMRERKKITFCITISACSGSIECQHSHGICSFGIAGLLERAQLNAHLRKKGSKGRAETSIFGCLFITQIYFPRRRKLR